jgi:hypothetical protein
MLMGQPKDIRNETEESERDGRERMGTMGAERWVQVDKHYRREEMSMMGAVRWVRSARGCKKKKKRRCAKLSQAGGVVERGCRLVPAATEVTHGWSSPSEYP